MASARISVTVMVEPWVVPYVKLMARLGCGALCEVAVRDFVFRHGVQVVR